MKRLLSAVCCGALVLSGVIFGVSAYSDKDIFNDEPKPLMEMVYKDISEIGARLETEEEKMSRLRRDFGDEVAEEICNAGPNSYIFYDLVNDTVEVIELEPASSDVMYSAPYIPDGLEVAEMPIAGSGVKAIS